jgi:hypothetical protein
MPRSRRILPAAFAMLVAVLLGAALAAVLAPSASAATSPRGYCSHGLRPGCVESTSRISTLTENSDSIYLNKGDTMSLTLCKTYSNSASLGAQYTAIKDYLNINFSVSLTTSYSICTGATVKATSSGYWHWYGYAKRWRSKVYDGMLCGAKYCITNYSYPIAQDRWYWHLEKG